jgi:hypothetical protein
MQLDDSAYHRARPGSGDAWASERDVIRHGDGAAGSLAREPAAHPSVGRMRGRCSTVLEAAWGSGRTRLKVVGRLVSARSRLPRTVSVLARFWLLDYGVVRRPAVAGITGGRRAWTASMISALSMPWR